METRLQLLTKDEVAALVATRPWAILPIGSTEQHGPTGLCGTDGICTQTIAERAGARAGTLVLPAIVYTPAQFNMAWAGTFSIQSRTLVALLLDIFQSAMQQSLTRLIIVNGHGANRAAIDVAMHDHYSTLGDRATRIETHNWWDLGEVPVLRREIFGHAEGMHATPSEISITQAVSRQVTSEVVVEHQPLDAATISRLGGDRHGPAVEHRQAHPDGLVGSDPSLANPDAGRRLLSAAVAGLFELLRKDSSQT